MTMGRDEREAIDRAYRIVSVFMDAERRRKEPPLRDFIQQGIDRMMDDWWAPKIGRLYVADDEMHTEAIDPRDFYLLPPPPKDNVK